MDIGSLAEWASAIATSAAVIVALFQDKIRSLIWKPSLEIEIKMESPDCHKIEIMYQNALITIPSYYFRLRITNNGDAPAKNIEVKLLSLQKKNKKGRFAKDSDFLPLNLKWSHTGETTSKALQPEIFKHCDLGHIVKRSADLRFEFDTEVIPNMVKGGRYPSMITEGVYKLDLVTYADNVKPVYSRFNIKFTGQWKEESDEMIGREIIIKKVQLSKSADDFISTIANEF